MMVMMIAMTPSVKLFSRWVFMPRFPRPRTMRLRRKASSAPSEHESGCAGEAGEGPEIAPADRFLEHNRREYCKHTERDHLLDDLELAAGEAMGVADTVGGHREGIFDERDSPTDEDRRDHRQMWEFEVAVPGEGHQDVGDDEQGDRDHPSCPNSR